MKGRDLFCLISVLICILIAGGTQAADKAKFKWRMQSALPEGDADFAINTKGVAKLIEEGSGGQVKVEVFPVGVLVGPDSIVDAVSKGAIEAGHIIAGMAADRVPSALGSEMPFGTRDRDDVFVLHQLWGMADIMRQEYAQHNIHFLTNFHDGQLTFQSTFPVESTASFKGKKVFAIPNCLWLTQFGASPVEVPGLDLYTAMKLGTINGMTWTVAELETTNLKEVVKHVTFPALLTPGTHLLVNKKAWDALGSDLQRQIQDHVDANVYSLGVEYDRANDQALSAAKKYGVKVRTLPPAEIAKLRAASRSFWDEIEGLSPHSKKMVELYKAFMKEKGIAW